MFLLFPTPVLKFRLDKHKEHKETYLPKVLELFNSRTGNPTREIIPGATDNMTRPENSYVINEEDTGLAIEDKQLDSMCQEYINFLGKTAEDVIRKSWFVVHGPLMHIQSHAHYGSLISGVYYTQFDSKVDFPTTFTSPAFNEVEAWELHRQNKFTMSDSFPNFMEVEEGDVVLFPSYLLHYVPASKLNATKERVTFVFNYLNK